MVNHQGVVCSCVLFSLVALVGCSAQREPVPPPPGDDRPCAKNLTVDGSFWLGRTFRDFQEYPNAIKGPVFDQVGAAMVSEGWQITNTNKDLGTISGAQTVSYGQGKTVPLNVIVKDRAGGGVRAEIILSISGGIAVGGDSMRDGFCKILEAGEVVNQAAPTPTPTPQKHPPPKKRRSPS